MTVRAAESPGNRRRRALITGATGAIGEAIARRLAVEHDFHVVLVARDSERAKRAQAEVASRAGEAEVSVAIADLSRGPDILRLAEGWKGPLDVLINNASTTPRRRIESDEGLEMQFAVNVLGYFRMIEAFVPILAESSRARIVNVASNWAGGLDLSDLQFERRFYDNDDAYRQSKQAERMLTVAFAKRLADRGIAVNACHPGDVNSRLSNDLGFGGYQTPDEGAETPVYLAASPDLADVTGHYFDRKRTVRCRFAEATETVERLFQRCAKLA